jgi:hypothetical protein
MVVLKARDVVLPLVDPHRGHLDLLVALRSGKPRDELCGSSADGEAYSRYYI